jgi:hypothetical protein
MKSLLLFIYGSMFLFSNMNAQNSETTIEDLIKNQFMLYPKMEARDLYKFLHQAAMGSEHAVKDTAAVRVWMKNEIEKLDTAITNNLIENLSPEGDLVRVNLRPYLKSGKNPDELLNAFITTANGFRGSKETLTGFINKAKKMIVEKKIPVEESIFVSLTDELAKSGYPAIHHSLVYEKLYKPAYRVIDKKYLTK